MIDQRRKQSQSERKQWERKNWGSATGCLLYCVPEMGGLGARRKPSVLSLPQSLFSYSTTSPLSDIQDRRELRRLHHVGSSCIWGRGRDDSRASPGIFRPAERRADDQILEVIPRVRHRRHRNMHERERVVHLAEAAVRRREGWQDNLVGPSDATGPVAQRRVIREEILRPLPRRRAGRSDFEGRADRAERAGIAVVHIGAARAVWRRERHQVEHGRNLEVEKTIRKKEMKKSEGHLRSYCRSPGRTLRCRKKRRMRARVGVGEGKSPALRWQQCR
ncbi:hypothetical protein BJV78DRAFT_88322 [Lactifluus subvellereus]|nr:hypothetical protein BJV78DRAFT_88322 [Lactifluus subvellereus]